MLPKSYWFRRAHAWVDRRISQGPVILMYHRVAEVGQDPWKLCVSAGNFAAQMEVLRYFATPVPLAWLTDAARRRRLPPRSIAVTFDDGYTDLLHAAKPLLEANAVPATAFITTGNLGTDREFWWDELERVLLRPGTLPAALELKVGKQTHRWELGAARQYSEEEARADRGFRASIGRTGTRPALYHTIWRQLFSVPEEERQRALAVLRGWAGDPGIPRATFRSLSTDEVRSLANSGLIEIGAHTVTHPALSAHSPATQRTEILQSKAVLEEILGHNVTSFSYPHGDYSPATLALMREAKVLRSCTVRGGCVTRRTDPFQLPRYAVEDWTASEFEAHLSRWLGVSRR